MANPKMHVCVIGDERLVNDVRARLPAQVWHVAHFPTGEAFLADTHHAPPGCIVARLLMPDLNCLALLDALKMRKADFLTIFVGASDEAALAAKAIEAGAAKCMTRPPSAATLVRLIQGMAHDAAADSSAPDPVRVAKAKISQLTVREREVLERIVRGLPNRAVALELAVSRRTVESYRSRLMKKLNVSGLAQLVHLAITAGMALSLVAVVPIASGKNPGSCKISAADNNSWE